MGFFLIKRESMARKIMYIEGRSGGLFVDKIAIFKVKKFYILYSIKNYHLACFFLFPMTACIYIYRK